MFRDPWVLACMAKCVAALWGRGGEWIGIRYDVLQRDEGPICKHQELRGMEGHGRCITEPHSAEEPRSSIQPTSDRRQGGRANKGGLLQIMSLVQLPQLSHV